ncbi:hypothetical protein RND81_10G120900 [Saponaria officinalis]|uniref:S-protein homolog n=1 Tax=Saponaria officinalis TaxID=3572 RepID=A0AAW1I1R8_SAPOF
MNHTNSNILLIVMLISLLINISEAGILTKTIEVRAINALTNGKNVQVHCRSKDDDVGLQDIPKGEEYSFSLEPGVLGNTLYSCDFKWDNNSKKFDIFVQQRDSATCRQEICRWEIKEFGPCLYSYSREKFDICYNWKK